VGSREELQIRYAKISEIKFIDYLQKKNAETLAFYPTQVFEREINKSRILLALVNGEAAGYLYHGSFTASQNLRIHQACIEYDLRGNWYGAALCKMLEDLSQISGSPGIQLRCGSDIAANQFWKLMGFMCVKIQPGGVRRMRDINVWVKQIGLSLFGYDSIDPSTKEKDCSIWRKGRAKTIDTPNRTMLRGQSLLDYREKIIDSYESKI
jgi:hypothetical protein